MVCPREVKMWPKVGSEVIRKWLGPEHPKVSIRLCCQALLQSGANELGGAPPPLPRWCVLGWRNSRCGRVFRDGHVCWGKFIFLKIIVILALMNEKYWKKYLQAIILACVSSRLDRVFHDISSIHFILLNDNDNGTQLAPGNERRHPSPHPPSFLPSSDPHSLCVAVAYSVGWLQNLPGWVLRSTLYLD